VAQKKPAGRSTMICFPEVVQVTYMDAFPFGIFSPMLYVLRVFAWMVSGRWGGLR